MKKSFNYTAIIAVLIGITCCNPNESEQSRDMQGGKRIKMIMESVHDPVEDADGLEYYPEVATQSHIIKTTFDPMGRTLLREKYNSKGAPLEKEVYKYNEIGNLVEQNVFHFQTVARRKTFRYDATHRLIESQEFNGDGKYVGRELIRYEADGNSTRTRYRSSNGTFIKISESFFNKEGNNEENLFYTNNRISNRELNKFNAMGQRVESITSTTSKENDRTTYFKYDSLGHHIEQVELNHNAIVEVRIRLAYDAQGNVRDISSYGIKGSLKERVKHEYEYDEFGNWVKDVTFINRKPTSVLVRKIEYH